MLRKLAMCALSALLTAGGVSAQDAETTLIPEMWARQMVVTVPPARPAAPTIDGQVGYQEWYYASSIQGFIDVDTGYVADLPVRMHLCYDEQNVYVGLVIYRPAMSPTPRATLPAGRHEHVWWQDDNFELVLWPGRPENGVDHFYAFCGNSVGAWSNMRGQIDGSGGDTSWPGKWTYAAQRAGRDNWHAELAIPIDQFPEAEKPAPGVNWFGDVMNQQVTPAKKMIDLGLIWNLQDSGYRSPHVPQWVFTDENGAIARPHGLGRLPNSDPGKPQMMGYRQVFYNQGTQAYAVNCEAQLFRAKRPTRPGEMSVYKLWDSILKVRETGRPLQDPTQEVQAFRSEADLLREFNDRFGLLDHREAALTVAPEKAGFFNLEKPIEVGEYILAYRFTDAATGAVVGAQVVPYAILADLELTLRPHYLGQEKIRAEASLRNVTVAEGDAVEFSLSVGDEVLATGRGALTAGAEAIHTYLDTTKLQADVAATVAARLVSADGMERMSNRTAVIRPPNPDWYPNDIGRSKAIPPPFAPLRCPDDRIAALWQRQIHIGDNGLPESIIARGTEILAGPIVLDMGETDIAWRCARTGSTERDAEFSALGRSEDFAVQVRTQVHYDGTMRVDVLLDPLEEPVDIEQVILRIPVSPTWAKLATHQALWTDPGRAQSQGFAGTVDEWMGKYPDGSIPFTFGCYLGECDRGIQWFAESDRGWSNADEAKAICVEPGAEATVLSIRMIDRPVQMVEDWHTSFGLTVTPVKDTTDGRGIRKAAEGHPAKWDPAQKHEDYFAAYHDGGINQISIYMCDDNHFGSPRMYNPENERIVREYVNLVHENGFTIRPYSGWGVNDNIPQFQTFGQQMLAEPIKNIGWGCFLHNPASVWADWWLAGTKYTIEQSGFDGTYMDSTVLPRLLENELDGFAWTDAEGRTRGTYPIWALRDFVERLYTYTHVEAPKPATVCVHQNVPLYCIEGFSDQKVTGELHYHKGDTLRTVASLGEFRAFFMTHPNGVATTGLWHNWLNLPLTRNQVRGLWLLHDVPMDVGGGIVRYYGKTAGYGVKTQPHVRLHHIRSAFDGAEFIGYWTDRAISSCTPEGPVASAWVDRDRHRALVVLANLETEPWDGVVAFDPQTLALAEGAEAYDAMFDRRLDANPDGVIPLHIEPERYRLVIFGDRVPLQEGAKLDETADMRP